MRITIGIIISLFFCLQIFAQQKTIICGTIKSNEDFSVNIYQPINGYYNLAFFDTTRQNECLVNGNDSLYTSLQLTAGSFIKVYFRDARHQFLTLCDLLLFPGDSLHLHIDLAEDKPSAFLYSGSNARAHKLFNEINFQPYTKFIPVFETLNRLPGNEKRFIAEIDSIVYAIVNRFDSLRINNFVTYNYIEYLTISLKSLFYNEVVTKFLAPGKKREIIDKAKRDSIITTFFLQQDPTDIRLEGLYNSNFYINNYYNYLTYKKYNLNSIESLRSGDKTFKENNNEFIIENDFGPFLYIADRKTREDLWALEIIGFYSWVPGRYGEAVIKQYDSIFPGSKWTPLLYKQFQNKYVSKNIGYKLQSPIIFIEPASEIKTIPSLLSKLPKAKPVFIDIWASWCVPCVAEFGYNKELDSFLLATNINKLYISFDGAATNEQWKKAIQKYSLGGYHINATDSLKYSIQKDIYHLTGSEGMGIPRYIIVNSRSKIIIDDAYFPHDFDLLKKEILQALTEFK